MCKLKQENMDLTDTDVDHVWAQRKALQCAPLISPGGGESEGKTSIAGTNVEKWDTESGVALRLKSSKRSPP